MKVLVTTDTHYCPTDMRSVLPNVEMLSKIKEEDFDVMLHCGDIGSHETSHVEAYLKLVRKYIPLKPIYITTHNHDIWSSKYKNINTIYNHILKTCYDNNINAFNSHHPNFMNKYCIISFNSWYATNPPTQDENRIPKYKKGIREYLKHRSDTEFQYAIEKCKESKEQGKTTILFTHFPFTEEVRELDYETYGNNYYFGASLGYENFLDDVDYLFYGHTHVEYDGYAKNGHTRVVNVGSDYYKPKYRIFDI